MEEKFESLLSRLNAVIEAGDTLPQVLDKINGIWELNPVLTPERLEHYSKEDPFPDPAIVGGSTIDEVGRRAWHPPREEDGRLTLFVNFNTPLFGHLLELEIADGEARILHVHRGWYERSALWLMDPP